MSLVDRLHYSFAAFIVRLIVGMSIGLVIELPWKAFCYAKRAFRPKPRSACPL
jgi:hypothetical protein